MMMMMMRRFFFLFSFFLHQQSVFLITDNLENVRDMLLLLYNYILIGMNAKISYLSFIFICVCNSYLVQVQGEKKIEIIFFSLSINDSFFYGVTYMHSI